MHSLFQVGVNANSCTDRRHGKLKQVVGIKSPNEVNGSSSSAHGKTGTSAVTRFFELTRLGLSLCTVRAAF